MRRERRERRGRRRERKGGERIKRLNWVGKNKRGKEKRRRRGWIDRGKMVKGSALRKKMGRLAWSPPKILDVEVSGPHWALEKMRSDEN